MTMIVVLFNLKEGVDASVYEQWALTTDLPTVRQLASVQGFQVLRGNGLLGSESASPYRYIELLEISSLEALGADIASETMQRVAAEFQAFADSPLFVLTESIEANGDKA